MKYKGKLQSYRCFDGPLEGRSLCIRHPHSCTLPLKINGEVGIYEKHSTNQFLRVLKWKRIK